MERRVFIAASIIVFVFVVIVFRLWYLQVVKGREYREIADRNRLRIIKVPAPRGIIYDRNGNPLVKNASSFTISYFDQDGELIQPSNGNLSQDQINEIWFLKVSFTLTAGDQSTIYSSYVFPRNFLSR